MSERAKRHSWGEKVIFPLKSERECKNGCGTIKVSWHRGGRHWVEFWRDGECTSTGKTPVCEPVEVHA